MTDEIPFGEWLRKQRRALDLTRQALADQAGCAEITLRRIENGTLKPSKELAQILLEKLGIPELERPQWILFARGLAGFPTKAVESFPNKPITNLPTSLTTFIGREKEQVEIIRLIRKYRLVTLTGPGGVGKTRLSIKVGDQVLGDYINGVWLIELAALNDPALLPQTVMALFGIAAQPNTSPTEILISFLRAKTILLILDNCEHLLEACAQLADTLLKNCPSLKILATSRESLGITGEAAYIVPSLALPDLEQLLENFRDYESVCLFEERAQLAKTDFSLTMENASSVAQICHRLDGIPLAIELAAAHIRMFSTEQIAAQLNENFNLLTGGSRTALPRQQTIHASIDWSWNLLADSERILLRRLSVFAGSWILESAEAVCNGAGIASQKILDLMSQLVSKSLVVVNQESEREARYRFHEIIRQFAREKLWQAGEGEMMSQKHLMYFVALAEQVEPNLRAFDMVRWLDRLEDDLHNIRAALEWALKSNIEAELRLVSALLWFWHIHSHQNEASDWLERGLVVEDAERSEKPLSSERALLRGKALNVAGFLSGDQEKKIALSEEALTLFRQLGTLGKRGVATALRTLGNCDLEQGHKAQARVFVEESLSIFKETRDQFGMAECLNLLVSMAMNEGDFERARLLQEEALTLRKVIGDKDGMASSLYMLGQIAHSQYDFARAEPLYAESLALFREIGNRSWTATTLGTLADIVSTKGDYARASRLIEEGLALFKDVDDKYGVAHEMFNLGNVARFQGDYDRASQFYEETLTLSRKIEANIFIAYALYGKAEIARAQGDYVQAHSLHQDALLVWHQINHQFGITYSLNALAKLAVTRGKVEQATRLFSAIEAIYKRWEPGSSHEERAEHDQAEDTARAVLGEEAFVAAWVEGQKLTLDEAVALALEEIRL